MKPSMLVIKFFILLSLGSACQKYDFPKDTPKCIKQKIRQISRKNDCFSKVHEYEWKGQKIYSFDYGCCEFLIAIPPSLYDNQCNNVCTGWSECDSILNELTNEKIIWQKKCE
ncbi:MAG: hypothetical protein HY738_11245 [Bacteroidia bacterium]|nr:hypothetical protein [Bacteroidia bacterium]